MTTYAIMRGNCVENIVVSDNKESTEASLSCNLIEYTHQNPAGINWIYNVETGTFSPPIETTEL
jgi:hypothetical protein